MKYIYCLLFTLVGFTALTGCENKTQPTNTTIVDIQQGKTVVDIKIKQKCKEKCDCRKQ